MNIEDYLCQDFEHRWAQWAYFAFSCLFVACIPLAVVAVCFIFFVAGMQT